MKNTRHGKYHGFKAVIFDLDGTLLDTLADIGDSVNRMLAEHDFPTHGLDAYRFFIGDGWRMLVTRALPKTQRSEALIHRCMTRSREIYAENWNQNTRIYDGIPDLLDQLQARTIPLAVLSNKPHDFTLRYADAHLKPWAFKMILGQSDRFPPKPDSASALEVAKQIGLPPSVFLFVGDSGVDVKTADAAGMHSVGAGWGFRGSKELLDNGCRTLVNHPLDILSLIE